MVVRSWLREWNRIAMAERRTFRRHGRRARGRADRQQAHAITMAIMEYFKNTLVVGKFDRFYDAKFVTRNQGWERTSAGMRKIYS